MRRRKRVVLGGVMLLICTVVSSCADKGPIYFSGGLREEGLLGHVATVESVNQLVMESADGFVKTGKVQEESRMEFDVRGVKVLDSNGGRGGNYVMTFVPEYSEQGVLLGGEYRSGEVYLSSRKLEYDEQGRVVLAVTLSPNGIAPDTLFYSYDSAGCTMSGSSSGISQTAVYTSDGCIVSRIETDNISYKTEYHYDKYGRLTEKIFYSVADEGGTEEKEGALEPETKDVVFIAEYSVTYEYDKEHRLVSEQRRNSLVKDDFDHTTTYDYELFDAAGNWLRVIKHTVYTDDSHTTNVIERTITYHS